RAALGADHEPACVEAHLEAVAEADERVASEPLATLDTLQQKAGRERAELHECRHRGIEVTGYVEGWLQLTSLRHVETPKKSRQQKTHPGLSGDGFQVPLDSFKSRETSWPSAHSVMKCATTRDAC